VELRDRLAVAYEALPQADIERVNKILPDNIDTVRLALDLDSMASRYGISIDSIEATVGGNENQGNIVLPSEDGIEKTLVSFSFIANYSNFIRLLSDVERNLRIMDIEELSFQSTESGLYSYEVTVGTHWLK
jgi:hypothetical protein